MRIYEANSDASSARVTALEQKPIRPEAALESILHANPELILDEPILIIGRQVTVGSDVADLIACDQFGNVIVCEVKIGRSGSGSASEETALSQPQVYASTLSRFDYDDLDEVYQKYQRRLDGGEWDVALPSTRASTLKSAIEMSFGNELAEHEFNTKQRLVLMAEEITQQTADNVRFLLGQGLHFQCTEIRQYALPTGQADCQTVLVSSIVVDYELNRIRPKSRSSPTYPSLIAEIVNPIFSDIEDTVGAATLSDAFPDGFDVVTPFLRSRHPDHYNGIRYFVSPKPHRHRVTIGIHNMNTIPEVGERIVMERDRFQEAGFTVQGTPQYNLIKKQWSVDSVSDVRDLQQDISEHYKRMVLLGHDVLLGAADDSE